VLLASTTSRARTSKKSEGPQEEIKKVAGGLGSRPRHLLKVQQRLQSGSQASQKVTTKKTQVRKNLNNLMSEIKQKKR